MKKFFKAKRQKNRKFFIFFRHFNNLFAFSPCFVCPAFPKQQQRAPAFSKAPFSHTLLICTPRGMPSRCVYLFFTRCSPCFFSRKPSARAFAYVRPLCAPFPGALLARPLLGATRSSPLFSPIPLWFPLVPCTTTFVVVNSILHL